MSTYRFSFPTLIHFGPGVRSQVAQYLITHHKKRPLIVTDRGIAPLPFLKEIEVQLSQKGLTCRIFSEIWGNPLASQVMHGAEAFHQHEADSIIGIGGGAALDVAKAIAVMAHHSGSIFDYEDEKPGALPIDQEIPFWIALPTTAGTGSEVGRSTVISDEKTHVKKIIFSPRLMAQAVFADPELTLPLPAKVTAATGMDALTHCVESYLAKGYHPICDGIALEGLRLAAENLEKAVHEPQHLGARGAMLMSSMMGAIAFQKGLGLTHSCAHALSTVADLHHGLANGMMIDYALPFNLSVSRIQFQRMCSAVSPNPSSSLDGESFIPWLGELKRKIGIPKKLSEVGVKKEMLEALALRAFEDSCHLNNPRPCQLDDFKKIFAEAL